MLPALFIQTLPLDGISLSVLNTENVIEPVEENLKVPPEIKFKASTSQLKLVSSISNTFDFIPLSILKRYNRFVPEPETS